MSNERFEELMERKLGDGLSAAESRELDALTARDSVLREEHDLLMRTSRLLAEMTPVEPPADLKQAIMREVTAMPSPVARPRRSFADRLAAALRPITDLRRRPVLKIGFAVSCVAAAALVMTIVNRPVDPTLVSGSMLPDLSHLVVADQVNVTEDGATGIARTEVDSGTVVLVVDLLSPDDIAVAVSYDASDLRLENISAADGAAVTAVTGPGQVRLSHQGARQITLVFSDLGPEESTLHLQVGSGSPYYLATSRVSR